MNCPKKHVHRANGTVSLLAECGSPLPVRAGKVRGDVGSVLALCGHFRIVCAPNEQEIVVVVTGVVENVLARCQSACQRNEEQDVLLLATHDAVLVRGGGVTTYTTDEETCGTFWPMTILHVETVYISTRIIITHLIAPPTATLYHTSRVCNAHGIVQCIVAV